LFIDFTLHVLFIAHPRMNRKVSFGGLWDSQSIDWFSEASSALYRAFHSCHMPRPMRAWSSAILAARLRRV
jgi:hypothetical protein